MRVKVKKNPNAPAAVAPLLNMLHDVDADEIASVDRGTNQLADVILAKKLGLVAKAMSVSLDRAATEGPAHDHGPAEFPDGQIAAGTYRFGAGGEIEHQHTVTLTQALEPGGQVTLESSVGGDIPHRHGVTIQAGEVVRQRYERHLGAIAKVFESAEKDGISIEEIEAALKKADEEPRSFDEMRSDARIHEIDAAIDDRSRAFMSTTWEIVLSDEDDKAALILQAVEDFAAVMQEDVPRLFSGELAKQLGEALIKFTSEGEGRPTLSDVHQRVAKLLLSGGEGGKTVAKLFEKLNDEEKEALKKLREGSKTNEESVKKLSTLEKENADLKKAAAEAGGDDDVHVLLKGLKPEEVALVGPIVEHFETMLKKQAADAKTVRENFAKREKATRTEKIEAFVKGLDAIGTPDKELIEALEKAHDAGSGEILEKTLTAANESAREGIDPIGSDADAIVVSKGGKGSPEAAYDAVMKRAVELRKGREGDVTIEGAYLEAEIELPDDAARAAEITVQ
jgi:hypothetical protein